MSVASARLCLRSWYGHPDAAVIERKYRDGREASGDVVDLSWLSGLRCWNLLDAEGLMLGRAYEPTETTPCWVWVDHRGDRPTGPLCSIDQLTVMMVEYRLLGGNE